MFSREDTKILRTLARRVYEIAHQPSNAAKRELWRRHTSMHGTRPPVFVSPEGSWPEILPYSLLRCADGAARELEYDLLQRLFRAEHIADDVPIEKIVYICRYRLPMSECWGIQPERIPSPYPGGAWRYKPVIEKPADWRRLRRPVLEYDDAGAAARFGSVREAVGDILDVRLSGCKSFSFHLMHIYCDFRGLDNMMEDLILEPDMVREIMEFLTDGYLDLLGQICRAGLISRNDDGTYHYTGGLGYTDDLPKTGAADAVSAQDVWGAAEAQELACVSPEMHEEFALRYERRLLENFGLNGYGCCEDLTRKLDHVKKIKNLRRVGICPWADLERCADQLGRDYIMTWKPNPAYLAGTTYDEASVEDYLTESLRKAKHGYIEIVLRDTHTCRGEADRFTRFVRSARRAVRTVYGETGDIC